MKKEKEKQKKERAEKKEPKKERKPNACHTSTERLKNWQEVYATVEDIRQYLEERVLLRYNVVTHQTEVHWLTDFGDDLSKPAEWVRLTERMENTLWADMSMQKKVNIREMLNLLNSDFVPEYNPFEFYLKHLPPWNGKEDHILGLSLSVMVKGGTDEQLLFAEYLKKWLVAMVASWVDAKVVNNVMLVLIGEQGSYKTTWFSHLLPPPLKEYFYTKTNSGIVSKDDLLVLSQYGLVCWEELDSMQLKELNKLKAAMTMPSINERAAYARYHENRPHLASFCGTGNNVQFLSDPTGTRRWLPFVVDSIESPLSSPFDYEGIYSQAYALYRQGFRYWFDKYEIERLARHNLQFETSRSEFELIDEYFRKPVGVEGGEYLSAGVIQQMVGGVGNKEITGVKLGRALIQMGFESKISRGIRRYRVVRRTTSEQEQHRQLLDMELDDGGGVV